MARAHDQDAIAVGEQFVEVAMHQQHRRPGFARGIELGQHEGAGGEVEPARLTDCGIAFTADPAALAQAAVIIIAVPTPVDNAKRPDFRPLLGASRTIAPHLRPGAIVIYESTVYPGATETAMMTSQNAGADLGWERRSLGDVITDLITALEAGEHEINTAPVDRRQMQQLSITDPMAVDAALTPGLEALELAVRDHRSI